MPHHRLSSTVLAVLLAAYPTSVSAQLTVSGTIETAHGALAGARVELYPVVARFDDADRPSIDRPEPIATTGVDARGRFTLEAPGAGVFEVRVEAESFLPMRYRPLPLVEARELPPLALRPARSQGAVGATAGWEPAAADPAGIAVTAPATSAAPGQPAWIAGRVLRHADRKPLPAALVWIVDDPGAFTITGPDGRYRLPAASGATWLQAHAAGHVARVVRLGEDHLDARRAPTVALRPAARVDGRVVDATGAPIAGAAVAAVGDSGGRRPFIDADPADGRSLSGGQGAFTIAGLRADGGYDLQASAPGFLTAGVSLSPSELTAGATPVKLILSPTRSAVGRVLDTEERPIVGARAIVTVSGRRQPPKDSAGGGEQGLRRFTATTGPGGRFELPSVPAAKVDLTTYADGFEPLTVKRIEIPPGRGAHDLGTVVLVPGSQLSGRVVDLAGEGVAEARIHMLRRIGNPDRLAGLLEERLLAEPPDAIAGTDGGFRITELARGEQVHLLAYREGYAPAWLMRIGVPSAEPVTLVLEPGLRLLGTVRDDQGEAIAGAEIELEQQNLLPDTDLPSGKPRQRATETDDEGRFELRGLRPGKITVTASAHGFVPPPPAVLEGRQGEDLEPLELSMERGHVIEGNVSTTAGDPIAEVRIHTRTAVATTDVEGRYRLSGVPVGPVEVEARHEHYGRVAESLRVEPGVNLLDLAFEPGHEVRGRAVDAQRNGLADVVIELAYEGRNRRLVRARSAAGGGFRLAPVADGEYALRASRRGFAPVTAERPVRVSGGSVEGLEIVLERGTRVSGQVEGLDIEELADVRLAAVHARGRTVRGKVDYQGRFQILDLEAGVWQLEASLDGGRRQARARIVLEPGLPEARQDLAFESRLTLSGRVTYNRQPLGGTLVSVDGVKLAVSRSVHTDHRGAFTIEDLSPDSYRLGLSNPREHLAHNQLIDLDADQTIAIDLTSARISGEVRDADSRAPIAAALVYLRRGTAGEDRSMIAIGTDQAGAFMIPRVPAGDYRITARKDGYAPAETQLRVEGGVDVEGLELALSPTAGLGLVAHFADGRLPPYLQISVFDGAGRALLSESRPVGEDGRLRVPSVPPGTWHFVVAAPGAVARRFSATVPGEPVALTLAEAGQLQVRVPGLYASEQIAAVEVVDGSAQRFVGFDATGALRRSWPMAGGTAVVDGLPAGAWTLRVAAPDGREWAATAVVEGGATVEVALH